MASVFSLNKCFYCNKENVAGTVLGFDVTPSLRDDGYRAINFFGRCNSCMLGFVGVAVSKTHLDVHVLKAWIESTHDVDTHKINGMTKVEWLPRAIIPIAPDSVPDDVAETFLKAKKIMLMPDDMFTEAGTTFRKTLERAIKHIDPSLTDKLANNIDALKKRGSLNDSLWKFAHSIKYLGNEATHADQDISRGEAEDLQLFTELFLQYMFTLPAMIPDKVKNMK